MANSTSLGFGGRGRNRQKLSNLTSYIAVPIGEFIGLIHGMLWNRRENDSSDQWSLSDAQKWQFYQKIR